MKTGYMLGIGRMEEEKERRKEGGKGMETTRKRCRREDKMLCGGKK